MMRQTILILTLIYALATLWIAATALAAPDARNALVIGNGAYWHIVNLNNPANDARDMAAALDDLGFKVTRLINAGHREMGAAVRKFGQQIKGGGVGLFYYAGHGVQVKGRNYLLPVDAVIDSESDVQFESLDAGRVLGKMADAGNRLNVVILDACRDNPFARSFRSAERGLARMDAPGGTIIAYATAPGAKAEDGHSRNGVFTSHLLKHIKTPGLQVEDVLKRVRVDVMAETGGKQIPWDSSSLTRDFYFAGSGVVHEVTPIWPRPEKVYAELVVETNVAEAVVFLDGQRKGVGSLKIGRIAPGVHRLKVTAEGYEPYEYPVRLGKGAHRVSAHLEKIDQEPARSFTNSLGMKFVYIPPGEFLMGSPANEPGRGDNEPQRRVRLTKGFYLQTTETTQRQWESIMGYNPSNFKNCGRDCPVENVSWDDAQEFIRKLNARDRGGEYRLPTEAEWEYAARAGTRTPFAFGDCLSTGDANYDGDYPLEGCPKGTDRVKTVGVGGFAPNEWGLYDMHGNVWEWCQDLFGAYPSGDEINPAGPGSGSRQVIRGGSWHHFAKNCRSAHRSWFSPGSRSFYLGFRLARSLP